MAPAEPRYIPDVVIDTAFALSAAGMACQQKFRAHPAQGMARFQTCLRPRTNCSEDWRFLQSHCWGPGQCRAPM